MYTVLLGGDTDRLVASYSASTYVMGMGKHSCQPSRDLTNFEGVSRDPGITLACPGISCFSAGITSYTKVLVFHYANFICNCLSDCDCCMNVAA